MRPINLLVVILACSVALANTKSSPSPPSPTSPSPSPRKAPSISLAPSVNSLPSALSSFSEGNDDDDSGLLLVGALLPVSGDLEALGKQAVEALDIAVQSFENVFPQISMIQVNTKSDPKEALKIAKKLYKEGVRLFIGPFSSAETETVMEWIEDDDDDGKHAIVISPYATSTSLSKYKRLFRLSIDNFGLATYLTYQLSAAIADSTTTIYPIVRDDVFANDFLSLMKEVVDTKYKDLSMSTAVKYKASSMTSAQNAKEAVTALSNAVKGATTDFSVILLVGFGETKFILEAAADFPELTSVAWFSNGAALDETIISSPKSLEVASKVSLQAIEYRGNYVLQDTHLVEFMDKMFARTQATANPLVALTHDALLLVHDTSVHLHSVDSEVLLKNLKREAKYEYGVSGRLTLTDDNQRDGGEFIVAIVSPIPELDITWQINGIVVADAANNHTVASSRFVGGLDLVKESVESCTNAQVTVEYLNAGFSRVTKTLDKETIMNNEVGVPVIGSIRVTTECDGVSTERFCPYALTGQTVQCVKSVSQTSNKREIGQFTQAQINYYCQFLAIVKRCKELGSFPIGTYQRAFYAYYACPDRINFAKKYCY